MGQSKDWLVPTFRFANPVRSATSFSEGVAEYKPQRWGSAMSNPAPGTPVPSVFQFESKEVRIFVDDQGKPWFCARDVCAVLGYVNDSDAIKKHCRESGVAKRYLSSGGQRREIAFIHEGNLYRLIIKSHLPAAERFEAWVCDEVLPTIRKTGKYETPSRSSDIRMRHSNARIDIELQPDNSGDIHYVGLTRSNAADMLRVAMHAVLKVSGVNCGEDTV